MSSGGTGASEAGWLCKIIAEGGQGTFFNSMNLITLNKFYNFGFGVTNFSNEVIIEAPVWSSFLSFTILDGPNGPYNLVLGVRTSLNEVTNQSNETTFLNRIWSSILCFSNPVDIDGQAQPPVKWKHRTDPRDSTLPDLDNHYICEKGQIGCLAFPGLAWGFAFKIWHSSTDLQMMDYAQYQYK
ncbi:hypothetical protein B0H15DRAFT_807358 [Mycena belliarum]|uniref:Uncharacterized protein n=1 Tax=Mycena belliarum TaxID=1033014 RepID=A0AAD6TL84_9AGAR|nr:hypothetical protein B0H15DRAFT_807358 [Mycena belliae]